MRKLLIISCIIFGALPARAQILENETRAELDMNMHQQNISRERVRQNRIREVKTITCKDDTAGGYLSMVARYDPLGNMTEYISYKKSGRPDYHYSCTFDDSSRVLEYKEYRAGGKTKYRMVSTYDSAGNRTGQTSYGISWPGKNEKTWWHSTATFDAKQNMLELIYYAGGDDKKIFSRYAYSYYDDGSKKQTIEYNRRGKVKHTWNFECNPSGTPQENLKDTSRICIRYETDKNGNKIRVKEENVKYGKIVRIVSKFDVNENMVELLQYNAKGKILFQRISVFDERNHLIRNTVYRHGRTKPHERSEWRYDTEGNVSQVIAYKSEDAPQRIMKFTYLK